MSEERTKFIYWYAESMGKDEACAAHVWDNNHGIALAWRAAAPAQPVAPSPECATFEMWWADHAPNSGREEAWAEWCALWPSQQAAQAGEYPADTGNPEADRIIGRLASSDPDFDDCADAVALIHKLVAEIKGPDGFDTWKDAAIADRAASSVYSRSMNLVRVFWQQHTQADALSMSMDELHADAELVIRAARSAPAQAEAPVQAGEPWYGHKFKEQHRGIWRCECGKTVKEATADWLDSVLEDAARYRWLRINAIGAFRTNDGKGPVSVYHLSKIPAIPGIPEETDAAIDAAIAAQQGEKHE